jgi:hypothetical protein
MYRCNWQNRTMAALEMAATTSVLNNNPSAHCYFQRMLDQSSSEINCSLQLLPVTNHPLNRIHESVEEL